MSIGKRVKQIVRHEVEGSAAKPRQSRRIKLFARIGTIVLIFRAFMAAHIILPSSNGSLHSSVVPIARVLLFNGTVCEISSKLKHVGVGYQGHVFSADMNCPKGTMHVAVKLVARPMGLSTNFKRDTWKYMSLGNKGKEKSKALYDRLMVNATYDIQNYFALTLGTADIPPVLLSDAVTVANQDSKVKAKFKEVVISEGQGDNVLVAEVTEFVPGGPVYPEKGESGAIFTPETKRLIVKDLVRMFRHMYDRKVAHNDVFGKHVFFSLLSNQTKLIDFGYASILDNKPRKRRDRLRQFEVWNLLAIIGNLCMHEETPFKTVFFKAGHRTDPERLMKKLIPALEMCNFKQNMAWTEQLLLNTEQTFQALAEWSSS